MKISEAKQILRDYYRISNPSEEQDFKFTETLRILIDETKDPRYMMELGGWYYDRKKYELAQKYYEMAAEYKYEEAYACLGYVWYYGRTGERDYEKAFKYYSLSKDAGNLESAYKIADMYKNGYFVEKDYEKYKTIIEDLYDKVKDCRNLFDPLPQIFIRLAKIRTEENKTEEAISLYLYAKSFLAQRLRINPFFGDLNNMKWIIEELYRLEKPDENDIDFYDLYYYLSKPNKLSFKYLKTTHIVESVIEEDECVICFDGKWFKTLADFFAKAVIGNEKLTKIYDDLYMFEVK